MTDIQDLDIFVPGDRRIKLRDRIFTLPGDMPMEAYLRVQAAQQESLRDDGDEVKATNLMVDALVELFAYKAPAAATEEGEQFRVDVREMLMTLGARTITRLLGRIYSDDEEAEKEEVVEGDPT